jgi:hypothetical protein
MLKFRLKDCIDLSVLSHQYICFEIEFMTHFVLLLIYGYFKFEAPSF